eukprot:tig00001629_g9521.t1
MSDAVRTRYPANATQEDRERILAAELKSHLLYWSARRAVKDELLKPKYRLGDVSDALRTIEELGLGVQLRNLVSALDDDARRMQERHAALDWPLPLSRERSEEPIEAVERVRLRWEQRMRDELAAISAEMGQPLLPPGPEEPPPDASGGSGDEAAGEGRGGAGKEGSGAGRGGGTGRGGAGEPSRAVYDENDLFNALTAVQSPNAASAATRPLAWGLIRIALRTPTLEELRAQLPELAPEYRQVGLDDELKPWFAEERYRLGQRVVAAGYGPVCRQFLKKGAPAALRPALWARVLALDLPAAVRPAWPPGGRGPGRGGRWGGAGGGVRGAWAGGAPRDALEALALADAREASCDESCFVFEEALAAVVTAFVRDPALLASCAQPPHAPVLAPLPDGGRGRVPRGGVVPFKGLARLAQPLCFLFAEPAHVYAAFRALYARYFCRLHGVSSRGESLLRLCRAFEELLQEAEPGLWQHLLGVGAAPLRAAFPWLMYAFAGFLEAEQLLLLWDRCLAFDSLLPVAALAAALFAFRAGPLGRAGSWEEVQELLADFSRIKPVPLLQHFLFPRPRPPRPAPATRPDP